uniref:Uncharacterized protein n=1 Tax=Phlebotomus papatasi TaxID=29031 RepID=A0A1B0DDJ4_PHLPP
MPRLIQPLAAAAALPIYAIVKPTLAPLAAVPLSMPAVAGAAVNGNNYEKTPSETETESSVATDYTEFVHHQPSHQGQHHQHHQQSNTEMSPHSHHQHQQSQTSGHQQISGQNAAGGGGQHTTLASMYTSGGHGQSTAYLPQGSQMYHHQMLQPSMPGNVYVSNMTANVNVHSFLGAQMPPQPYMQPTAPPFLPNDMTGQTVVATSHDQSAVHQPVNMPNMRMGGGGGPRRGGRGNKGGSHRRGGGGGSGGDYASRQQQDLQQQQQRQEQQRQQQQQQQQNNAGVPQPQEMMPHMMEPHQVVMGAPGYATAPPQLYYPYQPPSYYQPHSALPHLSAQHAAGHPLYVQSPALSMYPPGHQMGYQTHPSMLMYHTAMMSPAEYGMMDDKGDDQSVMSDGSVGVIGPMWHPQVQMDFPLDHGVMQPGQEEYLVQPEMMDDPAAGALIMPTMMSPQQQPPPSPAPTTGHHVLNPDVANFITRKQQMEQQAQQQSQMVHQQMLPTDFVQNQTMVKPVTSPQPVTETIPVASVTAQEMPSASPKSPVVVCSSNDEQQQMSQEMHHHHHQQQQVAFYEECREENTDNNIGKIETVVTIESVQQQQQQQQQQSCEQNNLLGNVTVPENVPSVAAINNNNNNNVVKPLKQEDTTRLAKMTNDKLMIKNDRGQKPPAWNKKSTTSVSVTALPSSTPITTSLTHNNADLMKLVDKQSNMSNGEQANGEVQTEEGGDDWQVIYGNRNKGTVTRTTDFGRTPISDIFGGQLRSRKAESVKEALEILVVKDQLEGVTCSKTNQEVAAWQQVTLEKLPVVLILHLKWFDFKMDSCTKILKTVEFPIELRIDT